MSISDSALLRQNTRFALAKQPKQYRMSRLGTAARGLLVQNIESASKSPEYRRPTGTMTSMLDDRLASLGLASYIMEGDGNCQFRAIADQLFGSQQHHAIVRACVVSHMKAAQDYFSIFFEDPNEFSSYLKEMGRSRTWGDELTLRAAVEAFGCTAHVVTSEGQNWYLVYTPEAPPPAEVEQLGQKLCKASKLTFPAPKKEVFINYSMLALLPLERAGEGCTRLRCPHPRCCSFARGSSARVL